MYSGGNLVFVLLNRFYQRVVPGNETTGVPEDKEQVLLERERPATYATRTIYYCIGNTIISKNIPEEIS